MTAQEPMEPKVSLSLCGERHDGKVGQRRWGRPTFSRTRGLTTEPMLKGADCVEAQLAPVIVDAEADD